MDPFFVTVAILLVVALALLTPLFTCNRHADVERGMHPLWEEKCSGKMGAFGISIPAIRLAIYEEFVVIAFVGSTVISFKAIDSVSVNRSLSFLGTPGVRIKLRNALSSYYFNSSDPSKVVALIEARL